MSLLEPLGPQIESDDILSSLRFLSSKAQLLPIDMAVETENATRTSVVSPKAQPKAHQLDSMLDQPVLVNVFEGEETGSAMKGFECIPLSENIESTAVKFLNVTYGLGRPQVTEYVETTTRDRVAAPRSFSPESIDEVFLDSTLTAGMNLDLSSLVPVTHVGHTGIDDFVKEDEHILARTLSSLTATVSSMKLDSALTQFLSVNHSKRNSTPSTDSSLHSHKSLLLSPTGRCRDKVNNTSAGVNASLSGTTGTNSRGKPNPSTIVCTPEANIDRNVSERKKYGQTEREPNQSHDWLETFLVPNCFDSFPLLSIHIPKDNYTTSILDPTASADDNQLINHKQRPSSCSTNKMSHDAHRYAPICAGVERLRYQTVDEHVQSCLNTLAAFCGVCIDIIHVSHSPRRTATTDTPPPAIIPYHVKLAFTAEYVDTATERLKIEFLSLGKLPSFFDSIGSDESITMSGGIQRSSRLGIMRSFVETPLSCSAEESQLEWNPVPHDVTTAGFTIIEFASLSYSTSWITSEQSMATTTPQTSSPNPTSTTVFYTFGVWSDAYNGHINLSPASCTSHWPSPSSPPTPPSPPWTTPSVSAEPDKCRTPKAHEDIHTTQGFTTSTQPSAISVVNNTLSTTNEARLSYPSISLKILCTPCPSPVADMPMKAINSNEVKCKRKSNGTSPQDCNSSHPQPQPSFLLRTTSTEHALPSNAGIAMFSGNEEHRLRNSLFTVPSTPYSSPVEVIPTKALSKKRKSDEMSPTAPPSARVLAYSRVNSDTHLSAQSGHTSLIQSISPSNANTTIWTNELHSHLLKSVLQLDNAEYAGEEWLEDGCDLEDGSNQTPSIFGNHDASERSDVSLECSFLDADVHTHDRHDSVEFSRESLCTNVHTHIYGDIMNGSVLTKRKRTQSFSSSPSGVNSGKNLAYRERKDNVQRTSNASHLAQTQIPTTPYNSPIHDTHIIPSDQSGRNAPTLTTASTLTTKSTSTNIHGRHGPHLNTLSSMLALRADCKTDSSTSTNTNLSNDTTKSGNATVLGRTSVIHTPKLAEAGVKCISSNGVPMGDITNTETDLPSSNSIDENTDSKITSRLTLPAIPPPPTFRNRSTTASEDTRQSNRFATSEHGCTVSPYFSTTKSAGSVFVSRPDSESATVHNNIYRPPSITDTYTVSVDKGDGTSTTSNFSVKSRFPTTHQQLGKNYEQEHMDNISPHVILTPTRARMGSKGKGESVNKSKNLGETDGLGISTDISSLIRSGREGQTSEIDTFMMLRGVLPGDSKLYTDIRPQPSNSVEQYTSSNHPTTQKGSLHTYTLPSPTILPCRLSADLVSVLNFIAVRSTSLITVLQRHGILSTRQTFTTTDPSFLGMLYRSLETSTDCITLQNEEQQWIVRCSAYLLWQYRLVAEALAQQSVALALEKARLIEETVDWRLQPDVKKLIHTLEQLNDQSRTTPHSKHVSLLTFLQSIDSCLILVVISDEEMLATQLMEMINTIEDPIFRAMVYVAVIPGVNPSTCIEHMAKLERTTVIILPAGKVEAALQDPVLGIRATKQTAVIVEYERVNAEPSNDPIQDSRDDIPTTVARKLAKQWKCEHFVINVEIPPTQLTNDEVEATALLRDCGLCSQTFTVVVAANMVSDVPLMQLLRYDLNVALVERDFTDFSLPFTQQQDHTQINGLPLVSFWISGTCCITTIQDDDFQAPNEVSKLMDTALTISLSHSSWWLIVCTTRGSSNSKTRAITIGRLHATFARFRTESGAVPLDVKIFTVDTVTQLGILIRNACETDQAQCYMDIGSVLSETMTKHEALLLALPCMNPMSSMLVLSYAKSLRALCCMPWAEVQEMTVIAPFHSLAHMFELLHFPWTRPSGNPLAVQDEENTGTVPDDYTRTVDIPHPRHQQHEYRRAAEANSSTNVCPQSQSYPLKYSQAHASVHASTIVPDDGRYYGADREVSGAGHETSNHEDFRFDQLVPPAGNTSRATVGHFQKEGFIKQKTSYATHANTRAPLRTCTPPPVLPFTNRKKRKITFVRDPSAKDGQSTLAWGTMQNI
eukprot:CFRG7536T1